MKHTVALVSLLALGCDSTPPPTDGGGGDVDSGPAVVDAGEQDAGGQDAGFIPQCSPGLPTPAVFDCASAPAVTAGAPMTGEDRVWTWVGFDEAVCMNGTSTGIGISLNPASNNLLILLEGGGACFDPVSCAGAANPGGYGASNFNTAAAGSLLRGILDRDDVDNPVRDWNFVYVPYCSGDIHGGANPSGVGRRVQLGYQNFSWFLTRIIPTFPAVEQVLLAGRSAGGLGTVINYPQTADAFGCTPVHLLNDAGGILPDRYSRPCLQSTVRAAWNLDAVIPDDCPECTCEDGGGLVNVLPYVAARYPDRRFGFASAMQDATMRTFYGYGYSPGCNFPQTMPGEDYAAGLLAARELVSTYDNFHSFFVPGDQHTFTYQSLGRASAEGTTIGAWIGQLISGDTSWRNLGP